jgi:hypothetical protein
MGPMIDSDRLTVSLILVSQINCGPSLEDLIAKMTQTVYSSAKGYLERSLAILIVGVSIQKCHQAIIYGAFKKLPGLIDPIFEKVTGLIFDGNYSKSGHILALRMALSEALPVRWIPSSVRFSESDSTRSNLPLLFANVLPQVAPQ